MQDLIERLEKAPQGTREMDEDIYVALGAKVPDTSAPFYWTSPDGRTKHLPALVPRYTVSIDAALTLVPDEMTWSLGQNIHHRYWIAFVHGPGDEGEPVPRGECRVDDAMNPAIALCIAALKARRATGAKS